MQDEPPPRAKRLLRKGVCIVAPLLLVAATVYAKVIARRRWEGRAAVKGYGDVFKGQAIKESTKLKGASANWVPFEARTHPDTPTKLWGSVKRPFPTGAWWTNLVVGGPSSSGDGLGTAFATPYTVSVLPDKGVVLGYGDVLASNESLTLATSLATGSSYANAAVVFSLVFVVLWVGAIVVSVNAQLLGGKLSLPQSVCVLGYSAFPVCAARLTIGLVETIVGVSRVIRFASAAIALIWATRASVLFVEEVIPAKRRALAVYPVFLFYSWLSWMVVVV